ncbi:MAG: helix-turn-helix domain-containing protein [Flavobacteriaceae bacterium]|nr:helix-turn-helix domain-containing protein [Flavobacteriaceae bacterium]
MINNSEFSKRLKTIMEYHQLSASSFADKVGVQRSSISHLLSGRNRPSLDFVLKVVKEFDDVELYWLLNGKGEFPNMAPAPANPVTVPDLPVTKDQRVERQSEDSLLGLQKNKSIERIVLFYTDGTFKEYLK